MAGFPINKGVGRSVEWQGLRAQYILYAVVGVVASLLLFFVCSFLLGQWLALLLSICTATASCVCAYRLNFRFGEHGLVQWRAARSLPGRIANHRRVCSILKKHADIQTN